MVESRLSEARNRGECGVVRAVVFDLDGVIISSEEVWDDVRQDLVGDRGAGDGGRRRTTG